MYQPVMSDENVRRLYFLKLERRKPMTRLLDEILNEYFKEHKPAEGGDGECTSVKSVETHSKSSVSKKGMISGTVTVPSAVSSMTP